MPSRRNGMRHAPQPSSYLIMSLYGQNVLGYTRAYTQPWCRQYQPKTNEFSASPQCLNYNTMGSPCCTQRAEAAKDWRANAPHPRCNSKRCLECILDATSLLMCRKSTEARIHRSEHRLHEAPSPGVG